MRSEKPLAILLIVTVIFFMTLVPSAYALPFIIITPSSGPPGTLVTIGGSGFSDFNPPCSVVSSPSGLISGLTCYIIEPAVSATFTVANVPPGRYTITVIGLTSGDSASGSFTVTPPTRICVIRLGVEQPSGTILWLPGYGYPDTPISQCQNMTEVLGQDVLGRTIVLHQYIENMTYEIVTVATPV